MLAIDGWLVYQRVRYSREIARLRAGMTDQERRKADMVVAAEQNRMRVALELMRRQANLDKDLHLSVAVDSGVMYLERDGALLREMPVDVGPEKRVGAAPDTLKIVAPARSAHGRARAGREGQVGDPEVGLRRSRTAGTR